MNFLDCVEIEPQQPANASVIWLHGLGANGHDFESVIPHLQLPAASAIRFVFPHAPEQPVTINNGMRMPAWYDILDMSNIHRRVDEQGLRESADAVTNLIEREIQRGVAAERILLIGFSQGGAVAYETAFRYCKTLAGVMGLSTYFATADSIEYHPANANIAVEIHHGTMDPVVSEVLGKRSKETLENKQFAVTYRTYPMQHNVCLEQLADISQFIQQHLG